MAIDQTTQCRAACPGQAFRAAAMAPTGSMGTLSHVWMPPLMQGFSERFEHVIECGHVSGLFVRR
jgi:hypothetical protein